MDAWELARHPNEANRLAWAASAGRCMEMSDVELIALLSGDWPDSQVSNGIYLEHASIESLRRAAPEAMLQLVEL